jgi:hypothetical protein
MDDLTIELAFADRAQTVGLSAIADSCLRSGCPYPRASSPPVSQSELVSEATGWICQLGRCGDRFHIGAEHGDIRRCGSISKYFS